MGCWQSSAVSPMDRAPSPQKIKHDSTTEPRLVIPLFGTAESGKSTFLKHIHAVAHGYNDVDRDSYADIIFNNTIQTIRAILSAQDPKLLNSPPLHVLDQHSLRAADMLVVIRSLWHNSAVGQAVRKHLEDSGSASYFCDLLDRMSLSGFTPTNQDIIRAHVRTIGISSTEVHIPPYHYKFIDVSGRRPERRKWIKGGGEFEKAIAIVFVVAMSDYDQVLSEDNNVNRIQDALMLFETICNSEGFSKTPIILLLNKTDLFAEKLTRSPMSAYFPDYTGGADYDAACDFMLHQFVSLNKNPSMRQIYAHYICAIESPQFSVVASAMQDVILQRHLEAAALSVEYCSDIPSINLGR